MCASCEPIKSFGRLMWSMLRYNGESNKKKIRRISDMIVDKFPTLSTDDRLIDNVYKWAYLNLGLPDIEDNMCIFEVE